MRRVLTPELVAMFLSFSAFAQPSIVRDVKLWTPGDTSGGWGAPHNATVVKDADGIVLRAGDKSDYGACFRNLGEVDLDQFPYFLVEVDRADGAFSAKLTHVTKKDKQIIFRPAEVDGSVLTHLPGQTGWKGKVLLTLGLYCHGAGKSLRVKRVQFLTEPRPELLGRFSQSSNLLYDASFESCEPGKSPPPTWHRLGSYILQESPWRVVSGMAFDGQKCLRTERPGRFVMQREIHSSGAAKYTFSVYLKAARQGHRAKLLVTTYRQGKPIIAEPQEHEIKVGADWGRYFMTIDVPSVRGRTFLGAVDLGVESLDEGELLMDAVQFELGGAPLFFGKNDSLIRHLPAQNLRNPLYPTVVPPPPPTPLPKGQSGTIRMSVLSSVDSIPRGLPMSGTVTLPQGQSYDVNAWRLIGPNGEALPLQVRALARWKGDGSIKCAEVVSEGAGVKDYFLEYGGQSSSKKGERIKVEKRDGRLRVSSPALSFEVDLEHFRGPEFVPADATSGFFVTGLGGTTFSSALGKVASVVVEEEGPVRAVIRVEGSHLSEKGEHLLSYVCRIYAFRSAPLVRVEYTWVNTNSSPSVVASSMAYRVGLGKEAVRRISFLAEGGARYEADLEKGSAYILQLNEDKKYFLELASSAKVERKDGKATGRADLQLAAGNMAVHVSDFWQNHPMAICADRDSVSIQFWPPTVKAVELTRGMSKTYLLDMWFGAEAPPTISPAILMPEPAAHCRSGVFGGEVLPSDGSPFPLFEKAALSTSGLGHMSPEYLRTNDTYGQFNYGDTLGDGGWGNLETQLDHAMWIHFIRTGNPAFFQIAQAAARHYRDIDVDQISGGTYVHNPSHTLSGRSTSHAWIQGTLDHYLATGERRSMEVALLHANFLKGLPLSELTSGGRVVTRMLDNFADLYSLTGDEDLLRKYDEICAYQRENIAKAKGQFSGLFQALDKGDVWIYPSNFSPWYGLYSLVKLRLATGDPKWEKFLLEEIAHAMAVQPFKYGRPEYFEENPLSDDERIVRCLAEGAIGDRGNMLFPALGYAYRWGKVQRYLDIGMSTVYIAMISGEYRDPLYGLAAVFLEQARQTGLGQADETRYYQKAVDIMLRAAHPSLANPGFEEGTKYWAAWRVKSTSSGTWAPIRKGCLHLDSAVKKEGRQSLHIVLSRQNPPSGFGVPLDSDDFVLEAGKTYRLEGWLREVGEVKATVALGVRPLTLDAQPFTCETKYFPPEPDGWRRWTIQVKVEHPSLGRLAISIARRAVTAEGEVWADGIAVR